MVRESKYDSINNPEHYAAGRIECIDAIESALTPEEFRGFLKGNVMKYVWRERKKSGVDSLRKAEWYQKRLIAFTVSQNIEQVTSNYGIPRSILKNQDRNEERLPAFLPSRDDPRDAYEKTDGMYHHLKIQEIHN